MIITGVSIYVWPGDSPPPLNPAWGQPSLNGRREGRGQGTGYWLQINGFAVERTGALVSGAWGSASTNPFTLVAPPVLFRLPRFVL